MFEAGYARALQKTVIPVLFDEDPNWHSWIDNPMNIARELNIGDEEFDKKLLKCLNLRYTSKRSSLIADFKTSINEVKEQFRCVDIECEDLVNKLIDNGSFVINNPYYQDRTAHFLTGFESFELYKVILDFFMYTGKYLWIYGRKNMKLFSGNYKEFFHYLEGKTLNGRDDMDGIDFKCLFLDPSSKEVKRAHPQPKLLESELKSTIYRANSIIHNNAVLKNCFRLYDTRRDEIIIRVDNCIIYSLPSFDSNGCPQFLTNTAFEVFSVDSAKGKECIDKFQKVWNEAKEWN